MAKAGPALGQLPPCEQPQNGVADLGLNSRVIGEDYSFSLESVPNFMESGQDSDSQANSE